MTVPRVSSTQLAYLARIAAEPGPVAASELFTRLRMSKLSIARMEDSGMIEKQMIDGRSHWRLTAAGISLVPARGEPD